MALTPSDLITDARNLAFPYLGESDFAPGALLVQLTTLDKEVVDLYLLHYPERISTQATDLAVSSSSNSTGYTLAAGKAYTSFDYYSKDGLLVSRITIVPEAQFADPPQHPAGIVRIDKFFPSDTLKKRWAGTDTRAFFKGDGDKIAYRVVAEPARVTSLTQTLASPDEALPYLLWSLVASIMLSAGAPETVLGRAINSAQRAREDLMLTAAKRVPGR